MSRFRTEDSDWAQWALGLQVGPNRTDLSRANTAGWPTPELTAEVEDEDLLKLLDGRSRALEGVRTKEPLQGEGCVIPGRWTPKEMM